MLRTGETLRKNPLLSLKKSRLLTSLPESCHIVRCRLSTFGRTCLNKGWVKNFWHWSTRGSFTIRERSFGDQGLLARMAPPAIPLPRPWSNFSSTLGRKENEGKATRSILIHGKDSASFFHVTGSSVLAQYFRSWKYNADANKSISGGGRKTWHNPLNQHPLRWKKLSSWQKVRH